MPVLKFRFNPTLHRKNTVASKGLCSWHAGECGKKPKWSVYTPMGWQAVCKQGLERVEEIYGPSVKG